MKYFFVFALFLAFGSSRTYAQDQPGQSATNSVVRFKEYVYDFGDKAVGSDVSHKFEFRNVSKQKIGITEVKASCGCTTPKYSTDPIKPGKRGAVDVKYDSKHLGEFAKTLTVNINDGEEIVLTIKGNIKAPDTGVALPR